MAQHCESRCCRRFIVTVGVAENVEARLHNPVIAVGPGYLFHLWNNALARIECLSVAVENYGRQRIELGVARRPPALIARHCLRTRASGKQQ